MDLGKRTAGIITLVQIIIFNLFLNIFLHSDVFFNASFHIFFVSLSLWLLFPSDVMFLFVWPTDSGSVVSSSVRTHLVLLSSASLSFVSLQWKDEVVGTFNS